MEWIFIASPALGPILAVFIVRSFAARSLWLQLGAAALAGAAIGAFLLSAASGMASAVNPAVAMIRGAAAGAVTGLLIGGLFLAVLSIYHRSRINNRSESTKKY